MCEEIMFTIPDRLFLLSLYEKRNGSIQLSKSPFLSYGLIAGSLVELVLAKAAAINSSKKLIILNPAIDKSLMPDNLIRHIMFEKSLKKAGFWIEALGRKRKRVEEDFLNSFLEKRILVLDGQVCHFHPDHSTSPTCKFIVKEAIRDQVLGNVDIDIETLIILRIMNSIHLLDRIFTSDEIKPIHLFIDQVKQSDFSFTADHQIPDSILGILDALNQVVNQTTE